ncbi:DsbA family protein [Candidatus Roizmanbacteria bacterium]|nr:DsbA family protein [Candidatus Roizmanbacteria bacterium]
MEINKNTVIISLVSLLLIFSFLFAVYKFTNAPQTSPVVESAKTEQANDHSKWSSEKKNILVKYSDLQCPACQAFDAMIRSQIEASPPANTGQAEVTKKITFIYRHFPLAQHQFSRDAAYAAEAAGKQGKFYEMVSLLFDTQNTWSKEKSVNEFFEGLAKQLDLNLEQFKKDRDSSEVKQKVNADYQSGIAAGVNATPTFFLNGQKVTSRSFDEFKQLLVETASK